MTKEQPYIQRFREQFTGLYEGGVSPDEVSPRVESFLTSERQRLIEEVREIVPEAREVKLAKDCGDCSAIPPVYCRHAQGWNDVREEMLSKLNELD